MYNFNHERWMINVMTISNCRKVIDECIKWANQRYVFGKKLIKQPIIKEKLSRMSAGLESVSHWLENITYQMNNMNYNEMSNKMAGPIALNKMQCTKVSALIASEAVQIFGGRGITRTGMGKVVERFYRSYKYAVIYGGSEEIMADLGIKQAIKNLPKDARL